MGSRCIRYGGSGAHDAASVRDCFPFQNFERIFAKPNRMGPARLFRARKLLSGTGLVNVGRKAWSALVRDTRDGLQVFVNGLEVVVRHVGKGRPRHDLEKTAIERRRKAAAVGGPIQVG
jgi:hypothetical protein